MYKRSMAFLLAAILAFTPVAQVNAMGSVVMPAAQEVADEMVLEEASVTEEVSDEVSLEPVTEESVQESEEDTVVDGETDLETESDAEAETTEKTDDTEVADEEETEAIEETVVETTEETAEETTEQEMLNEADILAEIDSTEVLTEAIDLSDSTQDASGKGWSWDVSKKTFTMNGYHSTRELVLPADSVIVLTEGSENSIDTQGEWLYEYGINCSGDLTIEGDGKLSCTNGSTNSIYVKGTLKLIETNISFMREERIDQWYLTSVSIVASNVSIRGTSGKIYISSRMDVKGCSLVSGEEIDVRYDELYNEETGLYELIFERNPFFIDDKEEQVYELYPGENVTLSVNVKKYTDANVNYQWYRTTTNDEDKYESEAIEVPDATAANLTVTGTGYGIEYYYCTVSTETFEIVSNLVAVVTGHEGAVICSEAITTDKDQSVDKLKTQGWKWDHTTGTLTLSNMDYLVPFGPLVGVVQVGTGYTVELKGDNYILANNAKLKVTYSKQFGDGELTTITGDGSLATENVDTMYMRGGNTLLFKNVTVQMNNHAYVQYGNVTLDNAKVSTYNKFYMDVNEGDCNLLLVNDSTLDVGSELSVEGNITVGEGCALTSSGSIIFYGTDFMIEEGARVISGGTLKSDSTVKRRALTVNGTLYLKERSEPFNVFLYSDDSVPFRRGQGVHIIYPEGAVFAERYSNCYGFTVGGSDVIDGLLIGKEKPELTPISADKKITGEPIAGNKLKAGEVSPKGAKVSYRWEYALSPEGPWEKIYDVGTNELLVTAKYHNYYLRVVMSGMGMYTGTVVSDVVGPVIGNMESLQSIQIDDGGDEIISMGTPFDGDKTDRYITTSFKEDGTVCYTALPVSKDAKVTIKNKTTGYEGVGTQQDIPVLLGKNEIEIEVNNNGKIKTYYISHTVEYREYNLYLYLSWRDSDVSMTATWTDKNGVEQSYTVSGQYWSNPVQIQEGTQVTITSSCNPFVRVFAYGEIDEKPDYTREGSPVTFTMKKDTNVFLRKDNAAPILPEGLSADRLLQNDNALVTVKAYAIPGEDTTTYEPITIKIADDAGKTVQTIAITGTTKLDEDGFYRIETGELDPDKDYLVYAYYNKLTAESFGEEVPDGLKMACVSLEKRRAIEIKPASDHIVLQPDETREISIDYNGYIGADIVLEEDYDNTIVSPDNTFIKRDDAGKPVLKITAAKEGMGTTHLLLKGDDHMTEEGMEYVFASVRVDVSSEDDAPPLHLGLKKGTLNLYDDSALTVPVYKMECGHKVEGAEFVDEALNDKFSITVINDRAIKVVPKVPEDDGTIDFAKWVKENGNTGTFTSKIKVFYKGAASRESEESLKITLTAKKPEVKVSAVSFNSYYTEQIKNLNVTVKGKKVSKVQIDTAKTVGTKVACPSWLSVKETEKELVFDGDTVPADKINTKVYLKVWLQGYRLPLQTAVTVKVTHKAPKFKLQTPTLNLRAWNFPYDSWSYPENQLLSADKNVKYEEIGVNDVRHMTEKEYLQMAPKEREKYLNPNNYGIAGFDQSDGWISFRTYDDALSGKMDFYVLVKNGKYPIKVTYTINRIDAPVMKLSKSSITVDKNLMLSQRVKLSSNLTGYQFIDLQYTVTMVGDKKKNDYSSHLGFHFYGNSDQELSVQAMGNAVAGKTYKVTVSAEDGSRATFKVKVTNNKLPELKASKSQITLNRISSADYYKGKTVKLSMPEKYKVEWRCVGCEILDPEGKPVTDEIQWGTDGRSYVNIRCGDNVKKGTYTIAYYYYVGPYSDNKIQKKTIKINVIDSAPKLKMATSECYVNKDFAECDTYSLGLPDMVDYFKQDECWEVVSVTDAKGRDAYDKLDCDIKMDLYLHMIITDVANYGDTYKVKLAAHFLYDNVKYTTVTVKVLKKNTKIKTTGYVEGSIDLARVLDYNIMAKVHHKFTNYSGGDKAYYKWEIYAKKGKKAITTKDGALNDEGLVGSGTSTGYDLADGSWFSNTPYSLGMRVRTKTDAWNKGQIVADYKYTMYVKLVSPDGKEMDLQPVKIKLKNGPVKFALNKSEVSLAKLDDKGRDLLTITDKDADRLKVQDIAYVEVVSDKNVPVSKAIEIKPIYRVNEGVIYSVNWKDLKASNVKSGTVKLNIYLEGNNPERKKPNKTLKLKVNVK